MPLLQSSGTQVHQVTCGVTFSLQAIAKIFFPLPNTNRQLISGQVRIGQPTGSFMVAFFVLVNCLTLAQVWQKENFLF